MEKYYEIEKIDDELKIIQNECLVKYHQQNNTEILSETPKIRFKTGDDYLNKSVLNEFWSSSMETLSDEELYDDVDFIGILAPYKERVQEKIVEDLKYYQEIYALPDLNIKGKDWDSLFDGMYDFYASKNMEAYFLSEMSKLNRFSIASCLLNDDYFLETDTYINSINYLTSNKVSKEELNILSKNINDKINNSPKILNFNSYRNRKR